MQERGLPCLRLAWREGDENGSGREPLITEGSKEGKSAFDHGRKQRREEQDHGGAFDRGRKQKKREEQDIASCTHLRRSISNAAKEQEQFSTARYIVPSVDLFEECVTNW